MKKMFLFLCIVITLPVCAQKGFGVIGGVNNSTSSSRYADWRVGGFIGGLYELQLEKKIYLQPRLVLSYQENQRSPEFQTQWNANLPVLVSLQIELSDKSRLGLNLGPYLQYAVFGRQKTIIQHTPSPGTAMILPSVSSLNWWHYDFMQKITYGGQIGAQLEYKTFICTIDFKHSICRRHLNLDGFENTLQFGIGCRF